MPSYTGYKVFKVTAINTVNKTITGTWVTDAGTLNLAAIPTTTPIKATFIKATDLEVNGTFSSFEVDFNYRNKF